MMNTGLSGQFKNSPECRTCGSAETVHHFLADCERTASARRITCAQLRRIPCGFSSVIALGRTPSGLTPEAQRRCLRITGRFVLAATSLRDC